MSATIEVSEQALMRAWGEIIASEEFAALAMTVADQNTDFRSRTIDRSIGQTNGQNFSPTTMEISLQVIS